MKIAGAKEVQQKQDMLYAVKQENASLNYRISTERAVPAAANGVEEVRRENYEPSVEGLLALLKADKGEGIFSAKKEKERDSSEDLIRALKIAQNIMRGKIVPPKDEQFLIEHNDKLYQAAKNIASMKEQTEKVKSELEEDEDTVLKLMKRLLSGEDSTDSASSPETVTAELSSEVSTPEEASGD